MQKNSQFLTCSCSAVKDVRALLAGLGWLSCSVGTAPSNVIPLPENHSNKRTTRAASPSEAGGKQLSHRGSPTHRSLPPASGSPPWCRSGSCTGPSPPPGQTLLPWTAASCTSSTQSTPDGRRCPWRGAPSRWRKSAARSGRTWYRTYCEGDREDPVRKGILQRTSEWKSPKGASGSKLWKRM